MALAAAVCLAGAMFFESRNQPKEAMLGVGQVTIEHAHRDKTTVCKAVKPGRFEWQTKRGKTPNPKMPADKAVYVEQKQIANAMLNKGVRSKKLRGKYYYFNEKRLGRRFKSNVPLVRIGNLVFY
jgi:hypothetical protein